MDAKKETVVYVKLDEYNDIKEIVGLMRAKLKQAKYLLGAIAELKKKEDTEIEALSSGVDHIEERVETVDRVLTEPEL